MFITIEMSKPKVVYLNLMFSFNDIFYDRKYFHYVKK